MQNVQIFGTRNTQSSRAAERFFKERRVPVQFVNLEQKPMAPGEIRRFLERFGMAGLIDTQSKSYLRDGLQYLKLSEADWLERIGRDPGLLRLPLVRAGKLLSVGMDAEVWKSMAAE